MRPYILNWLVHVLITSYRCTWRPPWAQHGRHRWHHCRTVLRRAYMYWTHTPQDWSISIVQIKDCSGCFSKWSSRKLFSIEYYDITKARFNAKSQVSVCHTLPPRDQWVYGRQCNCVWSRLIRPHSRSPSCPSQPWRHYCMHGKAPRQY